MEISTEGMVTNSSLAQGSTENLTIKIEESNIDPLKKTKRLYWIFAILGAFSFFILTVHTMVSALVGGLFGLLAALFTIRGIALIKLLRLNHKDYSLLVTVTEQELLKYLQENFFHPDIQVNKSLLGGIKITFKNKTDHVISLDEKRKSFWIHSRMTKGSKIKRGGRENSATVYRNAILVIPAIRELLEKAALSIHNQH